MMTSSEKDAGVVCETLNTGLTREFDAPIEGRKAEDRRSTN
jgi:hypothetical protein